MTTYICDDGNSEIEIEADSAQEAAQEYVDGGDWGDEGEGASIDVYVYELVACHKCDGKPIQFQIAYQGMPIEDHDYADSREEAEEWVETLIENATTDTYTPDKSDWTINKIKCAECDGEGTIEGDRNCVTIDIEPDAEKLMARAGADPECAHDWTSEGEGGCDDNPGVWSTRGTSMSFVSHCRQCGLIRKEFTTGSQRNPGEHDTVSYEMPDDEQIERYRAAGVMDDGE